MEENKGLKKCKTCGADIAKSAKVCPACGAKQKKHTVLAVIISVIVVLIAISSIGQSGDSTTDEPVETTPAPTKDEIVANATTASYKDLLRVPEEHEGEKIVLTVEIQQAVSDNQFRAYTDDGTGWYMEDEYLMYDERVDDDTKILDGDVVKVYGVFTGTKEITRALTGTSEEIPTVDILYIDLISE